VDPADEHPAPETETVHSPAERARLRAGALKARGERLAARAEAERARHASVDAVFEMVDRDIEVGGGIIAGALAYRFFIWLLPFALVAVAGLGIAADAASESPQHAAKSLGLSGLVSNSVASAADSSARWYALLIGIPVLLFATRSVLRVLIGAHRLVWVDVRAGAPKPTVRASLTLLAVLLALYAFSGLASAARAWSGGPGVLATLAIGSVYVGAWVLVSLRLPHRDAGWAALLPGAVLFGIGVELLQVVTAYVIAPWALAKQGTYGALGVAAALLFGLFLMARLVVGAAVVNATLWERRRRAE
jgi:uncharacterized BrkB/YihY/UPF0761 family membrane protein